MIDNSADGDAIRKAHAATFTKFDQSYHSLTYVVKETTITTTSSSPIR